MTFMATITCRCGWHGELELTVKELGARTLSWKCPSCELAYTVVLTAQDIPAEVVQQILGVEGIARELRREST